VCVLRGQGSLSISPSLTRTQKYSPARLINRGSGFQCPRCTAGGSAAIIALRYMLRITAVLRPPAAPPAPPLESAPVEISLFGGNALQWLFGAPAEDLVRKLAALRVSAGETLVPAPAGAAELLAADPLVQAAASQVLIGEVFFFSGLRECRGTAARTRGPRAFTAESMALGGAGSRYDTILAVCGTGGETHISFLLLVFLQCP
jgi:hypothetical protein